MEDDDDSLPIFANRSLCRKVVELGGANILLEAFAQSDSCLAMC